MDGTKSEAKPEQCGSFLVLDRIGGGGMAEGHRAVRIRRGTLNVSQKVFVKRLRSDRVNNPHYITAFRREARLASELRHANIATLVEAGPRGEWLAFELVEGVDLRHLLRSVQRLPPHLTAYITTELAKAFNYAHTRTRGDEPAGVVHRDVSPANVLVSVAGEVKLADFGVAQLITATASAAAGKIPYMAPEQAFGEPVDGRADLFALGVCMFEMLTGRLPAIGSDDDIVEALSTGRHPPLRELAPDVPAEMEAIVERLLSPSPRDRFASAAALLQALDTIATRPSSTCLELGELARTWRVYNTIDYGALDGELNALLHQEPTVPSPHQHSAPHQAEPPTQPQHGEPPTLLQQFEPPTVPQEPEPPTHSQQQSPTVVAPAPQRRVATAAPPSGKRSRQFGRRHTVAAAAAVAAACAVLVVSMRLEPTRALESSSHAATSPAPQQPIQRPSPLALKPTPKPEPAEAAFTAPAPPTPRPSTPSPSAPTTVPAAGAEPAVTTGTLRIGALPMARIWIDGKAIGWVGWSPKTLRLSAGKHLVSTGPNAPDPNRTRAVVITADRESELFCNATACE